MEKLDKAAELAGRAKDRTPVLSARNFARHFVVHGERLGRFVLSEGNAICRLSEVLWNSVSNVEVDSTFYGTPSAATVEKWYEKTPPDFVFAAKIPQLITHTRCWWIAILNSKSSSKRWTSSV